MRGIGFPVLLFMTRLAIVSAVRLSGPSRFLQRRLDCRDGDDKETLRGLAMRAFISHSSKDKGFVEGVANHLKPGTFELDSRLSMLV
jgi:hypothetical protein